MQIIQWRSPLHQKIHMQLMQIMRYKDPADLRQLGTLLEQLTLDDLLSVSGHEGSRGLSLMDDMARLPWRIAHSNFSGSASRKINIQLTEAEGNIYSYIFFDALCKVIAKAIDHVAWTQAMLTIFQRPVVSGPRTHSTLHNVALYCNSNTLAMALSLLAPRENDVAAYFKLLSLLIMPAAVPAEGCALIIILNRSEHREKFTELYKRWPLSFQQIIEGFIATYEGLYQNPLVCKISRIQIRSATGQEDEWPNGVRWRL